MHKHLCVLTVAAMIAFTDGAAVAQCCGGCNGNGAVTVDELVVAATHALTTCENDTGAVPPAQRLKTGQTLCERGDGTLGACPGSPAGQDGELQKGVARQYVDNGDGTITDTKTGLMWEKLSNDGTIHDYGNLYAWQTALTSKIATLNSGGGFAGHTDWRLPNVNELQSLVNYGTFNPAVDAAFNKDCVPTCTVTTCSCTQSNYYWSSTTYQYFPLGAWLVGFHSADVNPFSKPLFYYVRAVRGGL